MTKSGRTGEAEMQKIVLKILNSFPSGQASIEQIIAEVPKYIQLSVGDLAPSKTRDGEAMWEQIVRNIRSHSDTSKNYINKGYIEDIDGGYRITVLGREKVQL